MGKIGKTFALMLTVIITVSCVTLLTVKSANAQPPIPTPSVPTFTIQTYIEKATVPTSYSLNSSSGQIVAQLGYNYEKTAVNVIIKNQPFTINWTGWSPTGYIYLYYNIRMGNPDNPNSWSELYNANNGFPLASGGEYTNISLGDKYGNSTFAIEVEAMIGYISIGHNFPPVPSTFNGQTSGWSASQTVSTIYTINNLTPTTAPSSSEMPTLAPTQIPTITLISSIPNSALLLATTISLIVIAILLAVIIAMLFYFRRRIPLSQANPS